MDNILNFKILNAFEFVKSLCERILFLSIEDLLGKHSDELKSCTVLVVFGSNIPFHERMVP